MCTSVQQLKPAMRCVPTGRGSKETPAAVSLKAIWCQQTDLADMFFISHFHKVQNNTHQILSVNPGMMCTPIVPAPWEAKARGCEASTFKASLSNLERLCLKNLKMFRGCSSMQRLWAQPVVQKKKSQWQLSRDDVYCLYFVGIYCIYT